jgi:hypothetical protein
MWALQVPDWRNNFYRRRKQSINYMAILRNPVCTPEPSATPATTANAVNSKPVICVDYIDHGMRDTPWGAKPQNSFVFEASENGTPKFFTRTYNNYPYSRSALTIEIKNWLGRDISGDDSDWDLEECVGEQATLRTSESVSKAGNHYTKVESVNPGGAVHVQASGTYVRKEMSW